jgi:hypothetical protein
MRKVAWGTSVAGGAASAGTWKDSFIAAFVDAEGINRHPVSEPGGTANLVRPCHPEYAYRAKCLCAVFCCL